MNTYNKSIIVYQFSVASTNHRFVWVGFEMAHTTIICWLYYIIEIIAENRILRSYNTSYALANGAIHQKRFWNAARDAHSITIVILFVWLYFTNARPLWRAHLVLFSLRLHETYDFFFFILKITDRVCLTVRKKYKCLFNTGNRTADL